MIIILLAVFISAVVSCILWFYRHRKKTIRRAQDTLYRASIKLRELQSYNSLMEEIDVLKEAMTRVQQRLLAFRKKWG